MTDTPTKPSQATQLVALAMEHYRFGFSTSGEPYAIAKGGPSIALMFRGGRTSLRAEMSALFCEREGRAASSSALADALLTLEGMAQRLDPTELALRVAMCGRDVVVDLGTTSGEVVVINPLGWNVTTASPVVFRRTELTAPLPVPVGGGHLDALRRLVNVSDETWPVLVAWLVMALLPSLPHPILQLRGEQGTGKSTTAKTAASIVDPSPVPLRTAPGDVEAWAVAAAGSYIVPIDNVTTIQPWLSDALCRAVTGDGLVKRRLYSDAGLVVLAIRRVVILTSIDAGALRGDLADRLLPIDLERLGDGERRLDEELAEAFALAHPALLGALCTLTSEVLAVLPTLSLPTLPRMADAARVMAAVDIILGTDSLGTYLTMGKRVAAEVVEGDAVAAAVCRLVEEKATWSGTPAELLEELRPEHPPRGWPADATRLSGRLRRAAPNLRSVGVEVEQFRVRGSRVLRLSQGDAEAGQGDAEGDARGDAEAASVTPNPQVGAHLDPRVTLGDAKSPSPLCRLSTERGGNRAPTRDGGNSASSASSVTLGSVNAAASWAHEEGGGSCASCGKPTLRRGADGRLLHATCAVQTA